MKSYKANPEEISVGMYIHNEKGKHRIIDVDLDGDKAIVTVSQKGKKHKLEFDYDAEIMVSENRFL